MPTWTSQLIPVPNSGVPTTSQVCRSDTALHLSLTNYVVYALFRATVRIVDYAKKETLSRLLTESVTSTAPGEKLEEKLARSALNVEYMYIEAIHLEFIHKAERLRAYGVALNLPREAGKRVKGGRGCALAVVYGAGESASAKCRL